MNAHDGIVADCSTHSRQYNLPNCPILSENRAEERREGEWKNPENVSTTMPFQGVSTRKPNLFHHRLAAEQNFASPVLWC
jgi:hypothetical protein